MGRGNRQAESDAEEGAMTKLHLKYVQSFTSAGGIYHYFRRRGSPRIPLPGLPGSAEFMQAYAAALAASPVAIGASKHSRPGCISAAIAEYYGSQAFRSLTGGTPAMRRATLERFREKHGHLPLASLPKVFIVALLDMLPRHAARNWLKTLRHFIGWCIDRKLMKNDPTFGIRLKLPKSDGHHTWTDDETTQFEATHPLGSKARLAYALGIYTAQRREDVVLIGRQHLRDGVLTLRPLKTRSTTNITLAIPLHRELQATIDATPTGHLTLLTTKTGKSYSPNDFSDEMRVWCDRAGLPHCSFHGLRKAAARRLAEAGCTAHEIAAITGHASLKEVERYTRAVDQARLARSAMGKTAAEENRNGTESVKPEPAEVSKPLTGLQKNAG
jgi:integrase